MAHNPFDSVAYKTYRLPILATGLAGAYLVFSLVQLDADPQPIPPTTKVESHAPQTQQDFSEITGLHLFGQAALPSSADGFSVEPSQALQLKGVLYLPDNQAHAIIESSGHVQKTYRINDSLPGGAILQTIENNSVTLLTNNRQASLVMDKTKPEQTLAAVTQTEPINEQQPIPDNDIVIQPPESLAN